MGSARALAIAAVAAVAAALAAWIWWLALVREPAMLREAADRGVELSVPMQLFFQHPIGCAAAATVLLGGAAAVAIFLAIDDGPRPT
jgi:hypothetical protein